VVPECILSHPILTFDLKKIFLLTIRSLLAQNYNRYFIHQNPKVKIHMKVFKINTLLLFMIIFLPSCDFISGFINKSEKVSLFPVKGGKEFQFIDKEGKIVINPQFKEASIFRDGLALVSTSGDEPKWGFIGTDGKFAINAQYLRATVFSDGVAWVVSKNGPPVAIGKNGEVLFTLKQAESVQVFSEGLAPFSVLDSSGFKWGFVDKSGVVKINPQFKGTGSFRDKMCPVINSEGKAGYIDTDGKLVINYQFKDARNFCNGFAAVKSDNKWGVIDQKGKYVINPQFDDLGEDGDLFIINTDGKYGWCDNKGKIIINPQFEMAFPFNGNRLAAIQSGKNYGYIDMEGKILINPQFDLALPFNDGIALVLNGSSFGFIDEEGKYLINPQYDDVSRDYTNYVIAGSTDYESVETDYFNISPITDRIDFDKPEGLTLNDPFSVVIDKFGLNESNFSQYYTEHLVFNNSEISRDADLSFSIVGSPYINVGTWYPQFEFNALQRMTGFVWQLNLKGNGSGKAAEVAEALSKKLNGYNLVIEESNDLQKTYIGIGKRIVISNSSSQINISVTESTTSAVISDVTAVDTIALP